MFLLDQRLQRAHIQVHNDCEPGTVIAWCDQNRLEQVLINLIRNAADAMNEAPQRELFIQARYNDQGQIELSIADSGCGLAEDALDRLFEPFYTTKPEVKGTGLGLLICKEFVGINKGVIMAESQLGRGSVFKFTLPLYLN